MKYILVSALVLLAATAVAQPRLSYHNSVDLESMEITSLAFSGDERFLAAGTVEGNIFLLDVESATVLRQLSFGNKEVSALIFDSRGEFLISGSKDKTITVWEVETGDRQSVIKDPKLAATGLALSPDDKVLVACGNKRELYCWDLPSGNFRGKLKGHKKDAIFVVFGRDGDQLLSVGKDRKMIFWDLGSLQTQRVSEVSAQTMNNSGIDITAATCSSDRQIIAVAVQEHALDKGGRGMKFERSVAYFDWATGSRVKVISGNQKDMDVIRLTPQSMYVVGDNSSLQDFQLSVWDSESGVIETNTKLDKALSTFDLSGAGRWLASAITTTKSPAVSNVTLWATLGIAGSEELDWSPDIVRKIISVNDSLPILSSGQARPLAVLYFGSNNVEESIGRSTAILLESRLFDSPRIRLLERNQIDKIVDELDLQQSGMTVAKGVEIGRLIDAELILLGSVDKLDRELHITARLVEVNSGEVLGIREVTCTNASPSNISDMVQKLASAIAEVP